MSKMISICNQKGGVAKSTTTHALGYFLAEQGHRVLLVDLDGQANLTMCLGIDHPDELEVTIANAFEDIILDDVLPDYNRLIRRSGLLDYIPSNIDLADVELVLIGATSRESVLKDILEPLKPLYDYILIDCMPSLGLFPINAWTASDSVIMPTNAEYLSAKGLAQMLKSIARIRKKLNPMLQLDGVLITMLKGRTRISKQIMELLSTEYGACLRFFDTTIPHSVKVGEATLHAKCVLEFDQRCTVSMAYRSFGEEYLKKEVPNG